MAEIQIEICVDSVDGALAAQQGGAHRIELCANLLEGGTTPSAGVIEVVRRNVRIGLQVMIRPRGGDFLYSNSEQEVMRADIVKARDLGADGVVFGALTPQGDIDGGLMEKFIALARPMNVTFHRAFDMTRDPVESLEELIRLGVQRVLTSGQEASCLDGVSLITKLQRQAQGRIIVMPGGGITPQNVCKLIEATGVSEVHLSARKPIESGMVYRNPRCCMGGTSASSEYSWKTTDWESVRSVVEALVQN